MNLVHPPSQPLSHSGHSQPARSRLLPSDLAGILTHSRRGRPAPSPLIHRGIPNTPHEEQLIEQARKWVSQTFFGTLLKQMHNSPFKSPLFEGGRGGQAFGELYDQHMVDHMSRGAGNKLVGAMVRRIVKKEKEQAAKASAAYARHSTLGPRAASAPGNQTGADAGGRGDTRSFAQKRHATPPDIYSIRR